MFKEATIENTVDGCPNPMHGRKRVCLTQQSYSHKQLVRFVVRS